MNAKYLHRLAAAGVALALTVGVPTGMTGCFWSIGASERRSSTSTSTSAENTATRSVDAASVSDLRIVWSPGSAEVLVADDKKLEGKIVISETAPNGWHDTPHMVIETKDNRLTVRYGDASQLMALSSCSVSSDPNGKSLTITIPRSCAEKLGEVTFEGEAGDYALTGVQCERLCVDLSSGVLKAKKVTAQDLDVDVSSGKVDFDGSVSSSVDVDVASGSARVRTATTPQEADLDVSSGELELLLPHDAGFTAQVDVSSGSFDTSFKTTKRDGALVAGNGAMALNVDVASGSARVGKR